uniref:Reverse transcriptase domain-containing protein n=1 Tax=Strigamia maritima TaxID=126957 RepID=T1JBY5_STRMM
MQCKTGATSGCDSTIFDITGASGCASGGELCRGIKRVPLFSRPSENYQINNNWLRWNIEGTHVGKRKIYCLKFADDLAILAESKQGLQAMINDLERYVEKSKLIVNVAKRGGRRAKDECWWFEGQQIEVVKAFKYLEFIFSTKNSVGDHLRERAAKASKIVNRVWGIAKRAGLQDFGKLELLFDSLILSVVGYGVEVWGLRLHELVERVQGRFFKMLTGLDQNTPSYI